MHCTLLLLLTLTLTTKPAGLFAAATAVSGESRYCLELMVRVCPIDTLYFTALILTLTTKPARLVAAATASGESYDADDRIEPLLSCSFKGSVYSLLCS